MGAERGRVYLRTVKHELGVGHVIIRLLQAVEGERVNVNSVLRAKPIAKSNVLRIGSFAQDESDSRLIYWRSLVIGGNNAGTFEKGAEVAAERIGFCKDSDRLGDNGGERAGQTRIRDIATIAEIESVGK